MKKEEDIEFVDEDYKSDEKSGGSYSKIVFEIIRNITKTIDFGQGSGSFDMENREFIRKRQVISFCNQTFFLRIMLEPQIKKLKKPSFDYEKEFEGIDKLLMEAYKSSREEQLYLEKREEQAWKLWNFLSYLLYDLNYFGLEGITIS